MRDVTSTEDVKMICCVLPLVVGIIPEVGTVESGTPTCDNQNVYHLSSIYIALN